RGWLSVVTPFDFFDCEQPLREGAARFAGGNNNITALVGLEAALALLEAAGRAEIEQRVLTLAQLVRSGLHAQGHEVIGPDGGGERSGIVCFRPRLANRRTLDATALVQRLTSACGAVVAARNGAVCVSPHFYNTEEDITRFLHGLERVLREETPG
ncbi:MAG TPA: aminotransferase class V-fold PLP-dependent enzyme, partial [Ktedonobacterales bacterium]|nr:aminotransferase class V-fold PLP-dependent enzyme [Ktedonobacterales bacterium]